MTIERAIRSSKPKPWGVADLRAWSNSRNDGVPIGEIWFDRPGAPRTAPSLLLKLLFTSQPLSIQVHPDDAYAQSVGLPNGKTEAWYVLSAIPGAEVALGLDEQMTPMQLRLAMDDGSIADRVVWRAVLPDDVVSVPAGTIHAIGAGLVLAEIQQRSDVTYRLFDHGRHRDLHVDSAIAAAKNGPVTRPEPPHRLTDERLLLVTTPYFALERIELHPGTRWQLDVPGEAWLLVIDGTASTDAFDVGKGEAIFAQNDCLTLGAGSMGAVCLLAHTGSGAAVPVLAHSDSQPHLTDAAQPMPIDGAAEINRHR